MSLNYTPSQHGILNHSISIDANAKGACRVETFDNKLICTYLSTENDTFNIRHIEKTPDSNWSQPRALLGFPQSVDTPGITTFKDELHIIGGTAHGKLMIATYNNLLGNFHASSPLNKKIAQTPSFATLNGKLYMFFKTNEYDAIRYIETSNLLNWSDEKIVHHFGGQNAYSYSSPASITYQGLIHVFYKSMYGGFFLTKFDGLNAWTTPLEIIPEHFIHSPGITIHNGLLKLAFVDKENVADGNIYQYCYDGNCMSLATISSNIKANRSPGLGVLDGKLYALHHQDTAL